MGVQWQQRQARKQHRRGRRVRHQGVGSRRHTRRHKVRHQQAWCRRRVRCGTAGNASAQAGGRAWQAASSTRLQQLRGSGEGGRNARGGRSEQPLRARHADVHGFAQVQGAAGSGGGSQRLQRLHTCTRGCHKLLVRLTPARSTPPARARAWHLRLLRPLPPPCTCASHAACLMQRAPVLHEVLGPLEAVVGQQRAARSVHECHAACRGRRCTHAAGRRAQPLGAVHSRGEGAGACARHAARGMRQGGQAALGRRAPRGCWVTP